jgi:hypothetical protein
VSQHDDDGGIGVAETVSLLIGDEEVVGKEERTSQARCRGAVDDESVPTWNLIEPVVLRMAYRPPRRGRARLRGCGFTAEDGSADDGRSRHDSRQKRSTLSYSGQIGHRFPRAPKPWQRWPGGCESHDTLAREESANG